MTHSPTNSRLQTYTHIALWVWLGLAAFVGAQSRETFDPVQADDVVTWQVRGYGRTPQQAEENALQLAREQIVSYLHERGAFEWKPTLAFLRQEGMVQLLGEPHDVLLEHTGVVQEVRVLVTIAPKHFELIAGNAKQTRVQYRHELLALLLLGAVIVLLVVSAYLSLEEITKGYYTNTLRSVAILAIVLALSGLWWWNPLR